VEIFTFCVFISCVIAFGTAGGVSQRCALAIAGTAKPNKEMAIAIPVVEIFTFKFVIVVVLLLVLPTRLVVGFELRIQLYV
jgi:hypothetical protein